MPYPKPDDPDYCPCSKQPVDGTYNPDLAWHRCPVCHRLIAAMRNGRFFPHVSNVARARRRDAVQEGLTAYGLNSRLT